MELVEIDGMRICYTMTGAGPPLVLLQGYVADGHATWQPQIDALSDQFTVVVWDAPGAGASADPPESFGMAGYADILAEFVAAIGLDRPRVAGLSFGGAMAIELAHRHPTVPRSLVLASAYAGWGGSLPADETDRRLGQAVTLSRLPPDEFTAAVLPTMFSGWVAPETRDEYGSSLRAFHPGGLRAMAYASAEDLRDRLDPIDVPTLLIYGDKDVRAPLDVARRLNAAISGSRLVVLPDVGHLCNLEAPDAFNAAVRAFLHEDGDRGRPGR